MIRLPGSVRLQLEFRRLRSIPTLFFHILPYFSRSLSSIINLDTPFTFVRSRQYTCLLLHHTAFNRYIERTSCESSSPPLEPIGLRGGLCPFAEPFFSLTCISYVSFGRACFVILLFSATPRNRAVRLHPLAFCPSHGRKEYSSWLHDYVFPEGASIRVGHLVTELPESYLLEKIRRLRLCQHR